MSINIYKVKYSLPIPDPDMPQPRYHTMIFAQTNADGSGIIHHVTGDLVTGMSYEINQICRQQPPPPRQKSYNMKTHRTEQHKPEGGFYGPGEPRPPMIKCTEWTEIQAIPALYASGILQK
ncbi:MAG: hypothetical protein M1817_003151 [Caeruleum heppii]|nr:MAG: hypothetical protein M1817_003151 [Caeruleum heppii]